MTVMFDTLKFARTLRDGGGFTAEQAEGLSDAIADAMAGEVVGRADLKATETALHHEIVALRTELKADIAELRAELKTTEATLRNETVALRAELKADIAELRAELKGDIAALRTDMRGLEAKIEDARSDTIRWVAGLMGFQTITIIGAAVVLARYLGH